MDDAASREDGVTVRRAVKDNAVGTPIAPPPQRAHGNAQQQRHISGEREQVAGAASYGLASTDGAC
jgi:hypothetical protein